jgi:serine/threonine protein phosphatase PrpC
MNESSLFHVYQTLGERRTQEDVWSTCKIFEGVYLHAVFDGHGGKEVAMDAAKTLKKKELIESILKLRLECLIKIRLILKNKI